MTTIPLEELVEALEQNFGPERLEAWRGVIHRELPEGITLRDRMHYLFNEVPPALAELTFASGCTKPGWVKEYVRRLFRIMQDVAEETGSEEVFSTPTKEGERNPSQQIAEERFAPVTAEWDANKRCRLFMGELICYCE